MEIKIDRLTDKHIHLSFSNGTGDYPFIYDRQTTRLSRCTCVHGSLYRGNGNKLCYHAQLVVRFLKQECNRNVIP